MITIITLILLIFLSVYLSRITYKRENYIASIWYGFAAGFGLGVTLALIALELFIRALEVGG